MANVRATDRGSVRQRWEAALLAGAVLAGVLVGGNVLPSQAVPPPAPAAGAYDSSFGGDGTVELPRPATATATWPGAPAGDLDLDGDRVTVAVHTRPGVDAPYAALLAQVDETGAPAPFGPEGPTQVPIDTAGSFFLAPGGDAVVPDGTGKWLAAGHRSVTVDGRSTDHPVVRRYLSDGTPDHCWGAVESECAGNGEVDLADLGLEGTAATLAVDDQGRVVVGVAATQSSGPVGWQVARLTPAGSFDGDFGDGGQAFFSVPGTDDHGVVRVLTRFDRIYLVGHASSGEGTSPRDVAVARLTDQGSLDTDPQVGFGPSDGSEGDRAGYVVLDVSSVPGPGATAGSDDEVADAVLDSRGGLLLGGWFPAAPGAGPDEAWTARLDPDDDGDLDPGWGESGVLPVRFERLPAGRVLGVDLDHHGRLLVSGSAGTLTGEPEPALARVDGGLLDEDFGNSGSVVLSCPSGGALSSAETWPLPGVDGVATAGWCGDDAVLVRLLEVSPLSDLEVTIEPLPPFESPAPGGQNEVSVDAGPWQSDAGDLPPGALQEALAELQASPLRYSPLRYSPLRYSPLRYSPLRYSPLRYSPLRYSPVDDELAPGLPAVTLADVPLLLREGEAEIDWSAVLAGTPLADMPLQTVLVSDVLQLLEDPAVPASAKARIEAVELDQLDLSRTGWGDLGLGSYLLGGVPLADLPTPDAGSWCAYIQAHPQDAPEDERVDCGDPTLTLPELEAAGVDLEPYYAEAHSLVGVPVDETPLGAVRPGDPEALLDLSRTRVGDVAVKTLAEWQLFCSGACDGSLTEAQKAGELSPTFSVAQLLDPATGLTEPVDGVASLGDLLVALVVQQGVPFEALDLDPLLDALDTGPGSSLRYEGRLDLSCHVDGLEVQVPVPDGAEITGDPFFLVGDDYKMVDAGEVVLDEEADLLRLTKDEVFCWESDTTSASFRVDVTRPRRLLEDERPARALGGGALVTSDLLLQVRDPYVAGGEEPPTVATLTDDQLTLGFLGFDGATDEYRLEVEPGQVVDLTLSQLPADYDLLVYAERPAADPAGPQGVPNAPLRYSPLRYSPLRYSPVDDALPQGGASGSAPVEPVTLQGVPLRTDLPLVTSSTNRGQAVEAARVRVRDDGTSALRVEVVGFDAASSPEPYVLHTEVDGDAVLPPCLGGPLGSPGDPKPLPAVPATTQSLVLVHHGRMVQLYGQTEADALWEQLQAFAAHPTVQGVVVDVGADPAVEDAYAAWDDPDGPQGAEAACSPRAANAVVTEVNRLVDELRAGAPELRFLTLVGSDTALPMGRVPDLTEVANQRDYAPATRIGGLDNAVSRAFATGYVLSDDPYGALAPSAFLDTQLYVPDVATGRLVETPAEIRASLQEYLAEEGQREVAGSFVASYDFLRDLGEELVDAVSGIPGGGRARNDETWTRRDAREGFQQGAHGFTSVNAHYDNNRALPADQNALGKEEELLSAGIDLPDDLRAGLLATVGCNAGVNLPDLLVDQAELAGRYAALPASKKLKDEARTTDWAQRISAARGVLVAGTGFGYGDAVAVAYSERLLLAFAQRLDGTMTLGQALQFAKQDQLLTAGFGVYDHKAMHEATFYGLPQWRVGSSTGVAETVLPDSAPSTGTLEYVPVSFDTPPTLHTTSRGSYGRVGDEDPQVNAFRPVQPKAALPVRPGAGSTGAVVHGALLTGLTTTDVPVDPVVSVPVVDHTLLQPEPPVGGAFYPDVLQQVTSRTTPGGVQDALVLVAGQYRGLPTAQGRGVQRLVRSAQVQVTYSPDTDDFVPPQVRRVKADGGELRVQTTDAIRVVALLLEGEAGSGPRTWSLLELQPGAGGPGVQTAAESSTWSAPLPDAAPREVYVQAMDAAGNVSTHSDKGQTGVTLDTVVPTDPAPPAQPQDPGPGTGPTTTASASPTPTGSEAPVTPATPTAPPPITPSTHIQRPSMRLDAGTITVGGPVVVSGTARPGSFLRVRAYSRPGTEYRTVRYGTVGPDGRFRFTLLPRTNTRVHVRADGLDSDSAVVLVGTRAAMTARPLGDRTVLFSGRVVPYRAGTLVSLYRRSRTGLVLTAQAVTDRTGWWGVERRFLQSGAFAFEVRTNGSLVSAPGRSAPVRTTVR